MSEVYYCLYLVDGKLTVIEVQDFDIPDYDEHKFVMSWRNGGDSMRLTFDSKRKAVNHLNLKYRVEYIDPEYLSPHNRGLKCE